MEKEMTPQQSMELITEMIASAKQSFFKMSFYFLLWGALLALAGLGQYFLKQSDFSLHWIGWPIVGVVGGIIAGVHGAREGKKTQVSTFTDRVYMWLWMAFVFTLVLFIVAAGKHELDPGPYIMLLTGLPTFVTGAIMKFRPLVFGGVLFWVIGMLTIFFMMEYSALTFTVAILVGYIIPGLMLRKKENELHAA